MLAALIVVGTLLAAPLVYLAVNISTPATAPLAAVPIRASACPEIRTIRSTASDFLTEFDTAQVASAPWSRSRARLEATLAWLDASLTRGLPVVPAVVQERFNGVQANVRRGEPVVAASTSFADLMHHGYVELNAAVSTYGQAVTLVGDACGSLYVSTDFPPTQPDAQVAAMWAHLANWVCGPDHDRCR